MASVASEDRSAHERLWAIFTHYALAGNPMQPNLMRSDQFIRFAEDCGAIGEANTRIVRADVAVIVCSEAAKQMTQAGVAPKRVLSYHGFLSAVMRLAGKVYPKAGGLDASMRQFLESHVFPRARTRTLQDISVEMADDGVRRLLQRFDVPLSLIFRHYATALQRKRRSIGAGAIAEDALSASSAAAGGQNTMRDALRFDDFVAFTKDFGISTSSLLPTSAIAKAFLSSIDNHAFHKCVPKLGFEEFKAAIVRCSATLGKATPPGSTHEDKLKALFLVIWRTAHQVGHLTNVIESHLSKSSNSADLLAGTMAFNNKFCELWKADGHRDYMSPPKLAEPDAFAFITSICLEGAR